MELLVLGVLVLGSGFVIVGVREYRRQARRRNATFPGGRPSGVRVVRPVGAFGQPGAIRRPPQALRRATVGPPMAAAALEAEQVGPPWSIRVGRLAQDDAKAPGTTSRRQLLLRDTSAVLMAMGVLALVASQLPSSGAQPADESASPANIVVALPTGSLELLTATPGATAPVTQTATPTLDITRATLPPWCGNSTCTILATPSPSPKPSASPSASPTAGPTATPAATPTACHPTPDCATPGPTPAPTATDTPAPPGSPAP